MSRRFTIACPIVPLQVGKTVLRASWPLHVTLVTNFDWGGTVDALVTALTPALQHRSTLDLVVGDEAMFGPERTVPVNRIEPDPKLRRLHDALIVEGMRFLHPEFVRDGYQPHLTHVPEGRRHAGDRVRLEQVALVELVGPEATVRAVWPLG